MSTHMTAMETAPKRLTESFEEMQETARRLATRAYSSSPPSEEEVSTLRDLGTVNIAELEEIEKTFDKYPWQGSLKIRYQAYLDTMRQLDNAMNRGANYGNH